MEQHLRDVELAVTSSKRVNGIIGPNPFMKLPDFDYLPPFAESRIKRECSKSQEIA